MKIDLHVHSSASDGILSPSDLIDYAIEKGVNIMALTDHDVISGLKEAINYSKNKPIIIVPGIEISYRDEELGLNEIHIVGLFVDYKNKDLINTCERLKKFRINQKKKIIDKLKEFGYNISFEELEKEVTGESFGRPHIANILLRKYPEEFLDMQDVFDKLLSNKAYVKKEKLGLNEIINLIKNAGGIPILAHPGLLGEKAEAFIDKFAKAGGRGIEVYYPYSGEKKAIKTPEDGKKLIEKFKKIAKKKKLLISGGTDFHLPGKAEIGSYSLSEEEFNRLKKN
jgi:hypothetical protein